MKIGIIVHSQTGNTYSVAEKLKEKLSAAGHTVNVERISPVDSKQTDVNKIRLEILPDLGAYDALVFGAPVQAFSVSPVMKAYLKQLPSLGGKKITGYVTKGLPFSWTGGNQAIGLMKKSFESKGGVVCAMGIINWSSGREKNITDVIDKLCKCF